MTRLIIALALTAGLAATLSAIGWCVYELGYDNGRDRGGEEYLDGKVCFPTGQH